MPSPFLFPFLLSEYGCENGSGISHSGSCDRRYVLKIAKYQERRSLSASENVELLYLP